MGNDRVGGVAAVLTGVLGGLFILLTFAGATAAYDSGLATRHAVLASYALAVAGLLGLAAVPALSARVSHMSAGWLGLAVKVALLGFALTAVLNFWQAESDIVSSEPSYDAPALPYPMVHEELDGATATDLEIAVDALLARSPHGWIEVAGIGLWILTVSWLGLQGGVLPAGLAGSGIAAGFFSFCAAAGANLHVPVLHLLGTLGWSLVLPVWLAWAGVHLLRTEPTTAALPLLPGVSALPTGRSAGPPHRKRRNAPLIPLWPS